MQCRTLLVFPVFLTTSMLCYSISLIPLIWVPHSTKVFWVFIVSPSENRASHTVFIVFILSHTVKVFRSICLSSDQQVVSRSHTPEASGERNWSAGEKLKQTRMSGVHWAEWEKVPKKWEFCRSVGCLIVWALSVLVFFQLCAWL